MASSDESKTTVMAPAFGTMEGHGESKEAQVAMIKSAVVAGWRHFDTAELYSSTESVGEALAACGVDRSELWVTSKLKGMPTGPYEDVAARAKALAEKLKCGTFDLLLIHWPGAANAMDDSPAKCGEACSWDAFTAGIAEAWKNMHQLVADGITKRVGVSNFNEHHLKYLAEACPDLPAPFANQVHISPVIRSNSIVVYCQSKGIAVMGYRCLTFIPVANMAVDMGDPYITNLKAFAESSGAPNVHALVLRWLAGCSIVPVVKSTSADHQAANLKAATLTDGTYTVDDEALVAVAGGDMIPMLGGADEYAAVLADIGPPADPSEEAEGE